MKKPDAARCYIIAEAGVNHDGSVEKAMRLVEAAAHAGADCIKFQTFRADKLVSTKAAKAAYQVIATVEGETQHQMLTRLELPLEAYASLVADTRQRGLDFLCTPFDEMSLHFIATKLRLRCVKIGSGDLTNSPLLLEAAKLNCDLIVSTGMATLAEIEDALSVLAFGFTTPSDAPSREGFATAWKNEAARRVIQDRVVLLHCTTEYPAPAESVNLRAIETMREVFGLPVGFSDHTLGWEIPVAAVARGARVVEKHLTLDRNAEGPDHAASLDPAGFAAMVTAIRMVESALGDGVKTPHQAEIANIPIVRRSIVAACQIERGEPFTMDNLTTKRPGGGLEPIRFWDVLGRTAGRTYQIDEAIEPKCAS